MAQQFFGTSFIPTVLVRGLIGWEPDLPAGVVRLAPQLPAEWDRLEVHNAAVGRARYDLSFRKSATRLTLSLRRTNEAPAVAIQYQPRLPLGAVIRSATVSGPGAPPCGSPEATARDVTITCTVPPADRAEITIDFEPGYEVLLPPVEVERGARSRQLRLLDQRLEGDTLALTLEGPAGTTVPILVRRGGSVHPLVSFPEPGDSVDGYSRSEVRVSLPR